MRNAWLFMGIVAFTACSVNHVVVAELDVAKAGEAGEAAVAGPQGGKGLGGAANGGSSGADTGGSNSAGGTLGTGGVILIGNGGFVTDLGLPSAGAAGATANLLCSCLGESASVCGSDGVTYNANCGDGSACLPAQIACWHACPCLDDEPSDMSNSSLFPLSCAGTRCAEGYTCLSYDSASRDVLTTCGSTI